MMRLKNILILLAVSWISTAIAQGNDESLRKFEKLFYADLAHIRDFGFIYAHVEGTDVAKNTSNEIGLNDADMTNYLRLRFKNNFANIKYSEKSLTSASESEKSQTGYLWCRIWTVGTTYPVAYHIECRFGNFKVYQILQNAVLGYGNKDNVAETVRKTLDEFLSGFATTFFRVRGDI